MKILLDDQRNFPESMGCNCCRTYDECKLLLEIFNDIEFISLDYDLGKDTHTGLDILRYMSENRIIPQHINIHSDHSAGVPEMMKYANEHFPDVRLTTNKLV